MHMKTFLTLLLTLPLLHFPSIIVTIIIMIVLLLKRQLSPDPTLPSPPPTWVVNRYFVIEQIYVQGNSRRFDMLCNIICSGLSRETEYWPHCTNIFQPLIAFHTCSKSNWLELTPHPTLLKHLLLLSSLPPSTPSPLVVKDY